MNMNIEDFKPTEDYVYGKSNFDDKWDDLCPQEKNELYTELTTYTENIDRLLKQLVIIYKLTAREAVERMGEVLIQDAQKIEF